MKSLIAALAIVLSASTTTFSQFERDVLPPSPLDATVLRATADVAANSDVLILGELHGTREIPALGMALLEPLTQLGYGILAVEVPRDQQAALAAWATGKTTSIPAFFAVPADDGRGSLEALHLIRLALSPPYGWKLICFDVTLDEMLQLVNAPDAAVSDASHAATASDKRDLTVSRRRDALMAGHFAEQFQAHGAQAKVLAICGNLHARTANRASADSDLAELWPSFAAVLQGQAPTRIVRAIHVRPHAGRYFNGGRIHTIRAATRESAVLTTTPDADWDLELGLPRATPATFLAPPNTAQLALLTGFCTVTGAAAAYLAVRRLSRRHAVSPALGTAPPPGLSSSATADVE